MGSSYACNTEKIIYHFKPNSIGGVKFQIIFYPTLVIFYLKAVFFGLGAHSIFFISAHAEATYACNRWHNYIQGSISFLLDICFIYISNIILFPHFPYLKTPYTISQTPAHLPTHPTLLSWHGIPLQRGSKPSQDQRTLLSVIFEKSILCYICSWSHGSLHMYSLVGGLVPWRSGVTRCFLLLFQFMGLQIPSVL